MGKKNTDCPSLEKDEKKLEKKLMNKKNIKKYQ